MTRYLALFFTTIIFSLSLIACETLDDLVVFPKFELIKQEGGIRFYSYRSRADRMYPADSEIAEKRRIDGLEVKLTANKLPSKNYKILSRNLEFIANDRIDGYPAHFVNYVVQVPANP